jgi:hypothetical protein
MKKNHFLLFALLAGLLAGCISVGDLVWEDQNANGLQDPGEPGLAGVTVTLYDGDGAQLGQTTTDSAGSYTLQASSNEAPSYYLEFSLPGGYAYTAKDQGADDDLDSDADAVTGRTDVFPNQGDTTGHDAGLIPSEAAENTEPEDIGPATEETPTPTPTPTLEPEGSGGSQAEAVCYGPGAEEFPEGVSPLTGLPVADPALLQLNPVFLSVSIFPPSVRPPTGLSSAPMVYQLYIGDGDTRLLAAFYGEFPQPVFEGGEGDGGEPVDLPELEAGQYLIGDRVWFDSDGNALQDEGEPGVSGVPVSLLDINLNLVASTTTDAFGNYSFLLNDVAANTEFQVRFGAPPSIPDYYWVTKDAGDDNVDSDATGLGRTDFFDPTDEPENPILRIDAGLRQAYRIQGLRSGRVAYQDIQVNYCGCVVGAGADPTVGAQIRTCANAFGDPNNIGGAGLDVLRLRTIAETSTENFACSPNLSETTLICSEAPSEGGQPAQELYVQYNVNNISHFVFDEAAGAYLWYLSVPGGQGDGPFSLENVEFELMTDRLTGEALTFENVVVMRVNHVAENAAVTIIGLDMAFKSGEAFVFRNGQIFEVNWSTAYPDYVTNRQDPLPVHFEQNGEPFPMAPGQTWFNMLNQFDSLALIGSGIWLADFDAPAFTP